MSSLVERLFDALGGRPPSGEVRPLWGSGALPGPHDAKPVGIDRFVIQSYLLQYDVLAVHFSVLDGLAGSFGFRAGLDFRVCFGCRRPEGAHDMAL